MACDCNLVGLLSTNYQGIFSASIDGATTIEIADDGTVLLGQKVSNLSISAYAFQKGQDKFLGASCQFSAQANISWETRYDCFNDRTYFIPKGGSQASMTNRAVSGVSSSVIDLTCRPNVIDRVFSADAGSGPASPFLISEREDGYNLTYNGNPIPIESGKPQLYEINLGFVGTIQAFLQSFNLTIDPPNPARVSYSFVFSGLSI